MTIFVSLLINLSIIHNINFSPTTCSEISDCVFTCTLLDAQRTLNSNFHAAERKSMKHCNSMGFFLFSLPGFQLNLLAPYSFRLSTTYLIRNYLVNGTLFMSLTSIYTYSISGNSCNTGRSATSVYLEILTTVGS